MQTVQMNPPGFTYQTNVAPPRTLDDLRIIHDNYATQGSFSASSMRPVLIGAGVIAAIAVAVLVWYSYSEPAVMTAPAVATSPDPSLPSASSAVTSKVEPPAVPTAKDSPATDPLSPLSKSEAATSMPLAGHGNNHSSESLNPVKAKSSVAAKSASSAATRKTTPITSNDVATPMQQEATPLAPPAPIVLEPKPMTPPPSPAPDAPQVEPAKL